MNKKDNRRDFIKKCSLSATPFIFGTTSLTKHASLMDSSIKSQKQNPPINFFFDGLGFSPQSYLEQLNEINKVKPIAPDYYGKGGATTLLEKEFAVLTGKEKAIYLPSGTMANQLAIKLLNGNNTKVIVPENSHIFRDEADAAQSVHQKRLIPVGKNKAYFDHIDLKATINYLSDNEVFRSGIGTVVLENPIRRADGTLIPIETIKAISKYCRESGYPLHLDGARIHLAMAYTGISLAEYASYFDTVYISLYKYLNAAGGAILCGPASIIEQVTHQIKILGGTVFQSWNNTAMALHYLDGIDKRWAQVITKAKDLISELNKLDGIQISPIKNGTNIYNLQLADSINLKKLANYLSEKHQIWLGRANSEGILKFTINESILTRSTSDIIDAWKKGILV